MQNFFRVYYTNDKEYLMDQSVRKMVEEPPCDVINQYWDCLPKGNIYSFMGRYLQNNKHKNEATLNRVMQEYGQVDSCDDPEEIRDVGKILRMFLEDSDAKESLAKEFKKYFMGNPAVLEYREKDMLVKGTKDLIRDGFVEKDNKKQQYLVLDVTNRKKPSMSCDLMNVGEMSDIVNMIAFLNWIRLEKDYEVEVRQNRLQDAWLTGTFNSSLVEEEGPRVYRFIPCKYLKLAMMDKLNWKIFSNAQTECGLKGCRLDILQELINNNASKLAKEIYKYGHVIED